MTRFNGWPVLVVLAGLAAPGAAQEGPVVFEFSFSNPGARSMGLGGAFAALADDATAAFANPAGLVQLIEPEFSIEGRSWSSETEFVQGGRANGEPTGEGVDTALGPRLGVSSSDVSELAFTSLVFPTERWSIALYRHTWADFELTSEVNSLFGVVDGELDRSEDVRARTRVSVVNSGLVVAAQLTDRFSVGVAAVHFDAEMDSFSSEYAQDEEAFFELNPFTADLLDTTYSHQAQTSDFVAHAGFLLRATARWSFGGFYREGPELELHVVEVAGPADDESPEGTVQLDALTPLAMPDVYGLGLAFRTVGGAATVSFEWARVGYSSITDSLDSSVFDPGQIELSDGDELHMGLEYVFVKARPVVGLRLGAWRDPDHRVGSGPNADLFERTIFRSGEDVDHATGGLGLVFEHAQLDLGIDVSDRSEVVSLSLVYRF